MADNGHEAGSQTGVLASLTVTPCAEAIDFYVAAFGAVETQRMEMPDGLVAHAEIEIEGSRIMLGDEWPDSPTKSPSSLGGASTATLFIYTDDVEALWQQALDAGAEVVFPLEDQFYGDRAGRVRDPFGHTWGLGQQVEQLSDQQMQERMDGWIDDNG